MKRKKVWRYYCDYCKKAGCSGGHLKKHEERCTLNPNRFCGMCSLLEQEQPDLKKAIELLPDPEEYKDRTGYGTFFVYREEALVEVVEKAMIKLRDFTDNCPACILAALRQKGILVPLAKSFDYEKESKEVWAEFNDRQRQEDYSDCM